MEKALRKMLRRAFLNIDASCIHVPNLPSNVHELQ